MSRTYFYYVANNNVDSSFLKKKNIQVGCNFNSNLHLKFSILYSWELNGDVGQFTLILAIRTH